MVYEAPNEDIEKARYKEAGAVGLEADAAVKAGQVVKLTGDNLVSPSNADGEEVIGVATQSVAAGDMVTVMATSSRVLFTAGAAVTANDTLASHGATGDDGTVAPAALDDYAVGRAIEGAGAGETFTGIVDLGGQTN